MRAVVLEGPEQMRVATVEPPRADGRALIRTERAGLCGTDVKILSGTVPVAYPRVMGHEVVGTVEHAGPRGLVPQGARVLVDPGIFCGECAVCRRDHPELCPNGGLLGREIDGVFADVIAVDERQLHVIPETVPPKDASLLQVLGTCVHAQTLVNVFPGDAAVVIGLGVTGLMHVQLLRARGLTTVIGVTRSTWKRELAEKLGATATAPPDEAAALVAELTDGRGADLIVESAGVVPTVAQAIELVGLGGTVLIYGIVTGTKGELPFYELYHKELTLVNSRGARPRDYARAIQLTASGALQLEPLVSETYALEEAPAAFAATRSNSDLLKVTLELS